MRGRKPTPTALRELHGNPRDHAIPKEPKTPTGTLNAPDWLTDQQKEAWAYAVANAPRGVLRLIDRGVLAVWIIAEDFHRRASKAMGHRAPVSRKTGQQDANMAVINRQAMIMIRAASELGFSPTSRPRLAVRDWLPAPGPTTADGETQPLDDFLASYPVN